MKRGVVGWLALSVEDNRRHGNACGVEREGKLCLGNGIVCAYGERERERERVLCLCFVCEALRRTPSPKVSSELRVHSAPSRGPGPAAEAKARELAKEGLLLLCVMVLGKLLYV